MKLGDALKASRTLGQAINRSGKHNVQVVANDDALFQVQKQGTWYMVNAMKDLTIRKCFEPLYEGHLGLEDIELFLRRTGNQPRTDDLNPEDWEPIH